MESLIFQSLRQEIDTNLPKLQEKLREAEQQVAVAEGDLDEERRLLLQVVESEKAAQAAIAHIEIALTKIRAMDINEVAVFWEAVEALKNKS